MSQTVQARQDRVVLENGVEYTMTVNPDGTVDIRGQWKKDGTVVDLGYARLTDISVLSTIKEAVDEAFGETGSTSATKDGPDEARQGVQGRG
jgi:hypothetical protein